MNTDSAARREQFVTLARDLLRLQGEPESIEGEQEPQLCLTLLIDGMHCEVFHFEGASDVVVHCRFPLPAHDRLEVMRGVLTLNHQILRAHAGTLAIRKDHGELVFSTKASMDGTTPEALLESIQSTARWTPPWATTH